MKPLKLLIYRKIERLLTSWGNWCFDAAHHFEICESCGKNRWYGPPCNPVNHDF